MERLRNAGPPLPDYAIAREDGRERPDDSIRATTAYPFRHRIESARPLEVVANTGKHAREITRRTMLGAAAAVAAAAGFAPAAFGGWEPSESYPDPAIKVLDPSFARYRIKNASGERLGTGVG